MVRSHTWNGILSDEAATVALARAMAPHLRAGDVILLSGPIGAGKSAFARALIQDRLAAEGRVEDVPSPSFTLVQTYDVSPCPIWHADLYRLTGPDEVVELGLDEAFETAICLVEWPERMGDLAPGTALHLRLSDLGETRRGVQAATTDAGLAARLDRAFTQTLRATA